MKGAVSYILMQIQNSVSWKINKSDNSYSFTKSCWRSGDKNASFGNQAYKQYC